jgi:anti-anti-sigma factor
VGGQGRPVTACSPGGNLSIFEKKNLATARSGSITRLDRHDPRRLARKPARNGGETMLLELAPEWAIEIDRGPDWLFIRPRPPRHGDTGEIPLAEILWQKLEQCFCYRVVLELDEVSYLRSWMIGQIVQLHKRLATQGGMLRLCGVAPEAETVLRICRLTDRLPPYRNRTDAVMGYRPPQPR